MLTDVHSNRSAVDLCEALVDTQVAQIGIHKVQPDWRRLVEVLELQKSIHHSLE